ncbi:hypothetical protein ACT17Q_07015 [Cellulomonas sp. CW35]|uniref:hypothetical protein n=1 Tax=Cellulomonas sp. CW35 TaxID=3458249 RepID=UPI00403341DB
MLEQYGMYAAALCGVVAVVLTLARVLKRGRAIGECRRQLVDRGYRSSIYVLLGVGTEELLGCAPSHWDDVPALLAWGGPGVALWGIEPIPRKFLEADMGAVVDVYRGSVLRRNNMRADSLVCVLEDGQEIRARLRAGRVRSRRLDRLVDEVQRAAGIEM